MNAESQVRRVVAGVAIVAATLVLSGCAVAMLGGASRSGGSESASGSGSAGSTASRPAAQITADSAISTSVRSRFAASPTLKPLKIGVDTHDGVVTLRGQVNNVTERNAAQLEARAVKGVKAVKNELTVR